MISGAEPVRPAEPDLVRPSLAVVRDCPDCRGRLVEVRDRTGRPVPFDADAAGRAVRVSDGEWWAAKVAGQWRVVRPEPGEDPPASGGGARFAEHRCGAAAVKAAELVVEPVAESGPEPVVLEYEPGVVRRPSGFTRRDKTQYAECAERSQLTPQVQEPWGPPYPRLCVRCGRVTSRSDGDGVPWCGGALV